MTALTDDTVVWDFAGSPPRVGVSDHSIIAGRDLFERYSEDPFQAGRYFVPSTGAVLSERHFRERSIDRELDPPQTKMKE